MGKFMKGDVVVVPFPFSDLSKSKKRPALVVTQLSGGDVILCQITTPNRPDGYSVPLFKADFVSGSLDHDSNKRPNHLFTADSRIIAYCAGRLSSNKVKEVVDKIVEIVQA